MASAGAFRRSAPGATVEGALYVKFGSDAGRRRPTSLLEGPQPSPRSSSEHYDGLVELLERASATRRPATWPGPFRNSRPASTPTTTCRA